MDEELMDENMMHEHLIRSYKERMLAEADIGKIENLSGNDLRLLITGIIERFLLEDKVILPANDREHIIRRILDDTVGYGPLETFLQDEDITEIMVNGPDEIYIEREGQLALTNVQFRDAAHLLHLIDRVAAQVGRRIDESVPMVDARLRDGSRVHAILPPICSKGPILTIRKFRTVPFTIRDLLQKGVLSEQMAAFLDAAVKAKLNIVVSGGTGSGKTTLLNVLSACIPETERIVTIEDSAELRLQGRHVIGLETRPPNLEGRGEITIRELVRNALRMRPDRIVVGEVRGGEALDMLQAMNTGHEGSMTTIHANSPFDAVGRLETMVLTGGIHLPVSVIREYIRSAVDLVVQTARMADGSRRIVSIAELHIEANSISVTEIFSWRGAGLLTAENSGGFARSSIPPSCIAKMARAGYKPTQLWEEAVCS